MAARAALIYLLDTDWIILQALGNRQPAVRVLERLAGSRLFVSMVTAAELYERAFVSVNPQAHLACLRRFLGAYRLLPLTEPMAERFAEIRADLRRRGELIADLDLLIAATALTHDLTLLTFNFKDFRRIPDLRLALYVHTMADSVLNVSGQHAGRGSMTKRDDGVPLAAAAKRLDISQELVRKRIYRGLLEGYKVGGRWYVVLNEPDSPSAPVRDSVQDHHPAGQDTVQDNRDTLGGYAQELIDSQRAEIAFLRDELLTRGDELRRKDHIIAALTESLTRQPAILPPPARSDAPPAHAVPEAPGPVARRSRWKFWQWFWVAPA